MQNAYILDQLHRHNILLIDAMHRMNICRDLGDTNSRAYKGRKQTYERRVAARALFKKENNLEG